MILYSVNTKNLKKDIYGEHGKWTGSQYTNAFTGTVLQVKEEFVIVWRDGGSGTKRVLRSSECRAEYSDGVLKFAKPPFTVYVRVAARKSGEIEKRVDLECDRGVFLEKVVQEEICVPMSGYSFSAPTVRNTVVPAKVARLGQPVYIADAFFGQETPVGDNGIKAGKAAFSYNTGRCFSEVSKDGRYRLPTFVAGAAKAAGERAVNDAFFCYLDTVIRPRKFRIQFNSWYDNMLDITSERIEKSFSAIAEGFAKAGLRPLDCYVVDDGWTEYGKPLFWQFNKKFNGGFVKETELTEKLGGKFGVWFGPRGGYTRQTYIYAKLLESIGYHVNERSRDICTADPRYIEDLCARMAEFCKLYNVDYFKIDGFAWKPCRERGHNHPPAKGDFKAFYTFLWEEWIKGFEKIREANPDVCLNVTSFSHCSPWFLMYADYIWMNNASDMDFAGKGSDMQQCLNYRDGRYRDLFVRKKYRFPAAHLYNHEPTYAARNYRTRADKLKNKPIIYTDEEFSLYVRCCLMRGSGLAELYFSPEMMTPAKWEAAARELGFAERYSYLLSRSEFFGGSPERGKVYGYIAAKGDEYILMIRNAGNRTKKYSFDLPVAGRREGVLAPWQTVFYESLKDGKTL